MKNRRFVYLLTALSFFSFFLFVACGRDGSKELEVNFSFAVCPSTQIMQATPFQDSSGKVSVNISCSSSYFQIAQNLALIIYSDGNISIAPIRQGGINILEEQYLIQTISLIHKDGNISAVYKGTPGKTQDIVSFAEKTTVADISLVSGINKRNLVYDFFEGAISSPLSSLDLQGGISRKNIVFISSYLQTKNLSNVPFLIFDEFQIYFLNNYKLSDVLLNFPEDITLPDGITSVVVSLSSSIGETELSLPLLFPLISDINFQSIPKISERKFLYQFNITQNQLRIPLYLVNANNDLKVDVVGLSGEKLYFGKLENLTQTSTFMEIFPQNLSDIESKINFLFPDYLTQETNFELYGQKEGSTFLLVSRKISKEKNRLDITIPFSLISDIYYTKIRTEKSQTKDNIEIREVFERYDISQNPFVSYRIAYPRSEDFVFEASVAGDNILLSLIIPRLRVDELFATPIQDCSVSDLFGTYLSRDCISAYVEILGSDSSGENIALWRIYNLDLKRNAKLPNLVENKQIIFDALGSAPEIKIKEISLRYTAFFGNTIIGYTKTFRYDR